MTASRQMEYRIAWSRGGVFGCDKWKDEAEKNRLYESAAHLSTRYADINYWVDMRPKETSK